jgi:hypothetical protein
VTNGRMLWSAFALFPHQLTAILMLTIAGCGWLMALAGDDVESGPIDQRGLIALQAIAIPALIVARPEGSLLVVIALLPTLLCARVRLTYRSFLLFVFGGSLLAWSVLLLSYHPANIGVPVSISGPLALAVAALTAGALLYLKPVRDYASMVEDYGRSILVVAEAGLWIALALAAIGSPDKLIESVNATGHNLLLGEGKWGYSLVILGLFVLLCAAAVRGGELMFLRFPVTSFIPLAFLLVYVRGEAYRIGAGDSLNRMWIHVVPLAVLFVIAAASTLRWRYADSDRKTARRRDFVQSR